MLFLEPQHSPYDLHFRVFGIPIRVHPLFWLLSALLGWSLVQRGGLPMLLLWIACVFISVLFHELGHVWMGQVFGTRGHIVLYSFGGLAIGSNNLAHWWQRVAVSFAGPLAGFVLFALVLLSLLLIAPTYFLIYCESMLQTLHIQIDLMSYVQPTDLRLPPLVSRAALFLLEINLFWGLLNLLPIFPLDGGQISRDVFSYLFPGRGLRLSLGISFLAAAILTIHFILRMNGRRLLPFLDFGGTYAALMFGLLAVQSFLQLQQQRSHDSDSKDPWQEEGRPWER